MVAAKGESDLELTFIPNPSFGDKVVVRKKCILLSICSILVYCTKFSHHTGIRMLTM